MSHILQPALILSPIPHPANPMLDPSFIIVVIAVLDVYEPTIDLLTAHEEEIDNNDLNLHVVYEQAS